MSIQTEFIIPQQCFLYVVDPQERLMPSIHESDLVLRNIALLIRTAGIFDIPLFATTQYKKGIGPLVPEIADLLGDAPCPDKLYFNGFGESSVREIMDGLPSLADTMIICGVESHICVYQSVIGALNAGFQVWVAADAVSSRTPENDQWGRERMKDLGAVIAPTEMIIYEFLQQAGTEKFKTLLPYLK
ncbi:MAG: isochorismatase family protein [Desulfobulbaceae bacterium]|nr:isochorismatase family protein [Desulfobulbaceae bacterium]